MHIFIHKKYMNPCHHDLTGSEHILRRYITPLAGYLRFWNRDNSFLKFSSACWGASASASSKDLPSWQSLAKAIESRASNFVKMRITGTAGVVGGIPGYKSRRTTIWIAFIKKCPFCGSKKPFIISRYAVPVWHSY
jgi:hypothetical protein